MADRIIEAMMQVFIVEAPGRSNHEKMISSSHSLTLCHPDTLSDTGRIEPPEYVTILPHLDPSATPAWKDHIDTFPCCGWRCYFSSPCTCWRVIDKTEWFRLRERCAFGLRIESRTVLHENVTIANSSLLIVMRPRDLIFESFRVLHTIESGHSAQYQNLSSGQHAPHPVK